MNDRGAAFLCNRMNIENTQEMNIKKARCIRMLCSVRQRAFIERITKD